MRFSFLDDKAVRAKEKNEEPTSLLHYITLCLNKDPQYIQNYSTNPICNDKAFIHGEQK